MGRLERDLTGKVNNILQRAEDYHASYYAVETFGGPSLHFHRRALGLEGKVTVEERIELIYAVLTSWGMHRMGAKGSKMQPFDTFKASVPEDPGTITELTELPPGKLGRGGWSALERIFKQISVMVSGTTIVGNSKVLAHLLPNLVTPVDREYTLNYLFGNTYIQNGINREWRLLRKILEEFFYPVAADVSFQKKAEIWISDPHLYPWDTSILKVVDNLVIGAMKSD